MCLLFLSRNIEERNGPGQACFGRQVRRLLVEIYYDTDAIDCRRPPRPTLFVCVVATQRLLL
jgi:hypothetical protein